ncbi:ABC transporter substrate-binding protein [Nesterenkonia xinjiangensis]|uniref:Multiple sugar transport system substrate-binding protein n=1 Tax=Nesterenkonia xinjiangensis TaxID=225327 RepID=A0A7Z0GLC6_9MICC|nr:ABC transporter substrate-binding protein [Nesterenkonia xinjiangensis]NYJ77858.1 multiple sugar transport system substrate-binding protein [Nesterenkonia xinjiangensis]
MKHTKLARLSAAAVIGAVALTACGGDEGGADGAGDVEEVHLRVAWWGSDHRHANTEAIIDDFTEEHPHITIDGEFNDWTGYQDTLATQVASGDAPDVVQLDDEFIREYADRGALLELTDVDTSGIDPTIVEGGQSEGVQYAIPTGVNALVMMANPELFEEAGVEMPDDTTWTWEEFIDVSSTIQEETGAYGTNNPIAQTLMVWLRQQDKGLFTEDGQLGIEADDAAEYFAFLEELVEEGALPSASEMAEEESAVMEDSLIATHRSAMGMSWTNQLPALTEASGVELVPLRFPSPTGQAEDNGLWFKNTMLMGATSGTDHPEEAQLFIDHFINSVDAGMHNLMDRGLPSNEEVREAVVEEVDGQDLVVAELVDALGGEITSAEPMPPVGFTGISDELSLRSQDVFFGRMDADEAGESFVDAANRILE